jgi:hypothetical protein
MAFHQRVQQLILLGADLGPPASSPTAVPPVRLQPLIDSLASAHREADAYAIRYGHRYRSSFWAIYLLSALAVLCAMMPLALGWDSAESFMHPFAAGWVISEIVVIGAVALLYWRGHRKDWQGQWLRTRTIAEYISYLPLVAPLVDYSRSVADSSWYTRAMPVDSPQAATPEIVALCDANESRARELLAGAESDPGFTQSYGRWAISVLQSQLQYHTRLARRSHLLQHRIHRITATFFALTALAALMHLIVHSRWLSLLTTFCPALAAALHGALAQSEAYRLEASSQAVASRLQTDIRDLTRAMQDTSRPLQLEHLRSPIESALAAILQEHQDWYMLVQPHHLPLG